MHIRSSFSRPSSSQLLVLVFLLLAFSSLLFTLVRFFQEQSVEQDPSTLTGSIAHAEKVPSPIAATAVLTNASNAEVGTVERSGTEEASAFHVEALLPALDASLEEYRVWLVRADGSSLFVGSLSARTDGTWASDFSLVNPLSYTQVYITQESLTDAYPVGSIRVGFGDFAVPSAEQSSAPSPAPAVESPEEEVPVAETPEEEPAPTPDTPAEEPIVEESDPAPSDDTPPAMDTPAPEESALEEGVQEAPQEEPGDAPSQEIADAPSEEGGAGEDLSGGEVSQGT